MTTTERGKNETARAYEAFKTYAEMGAQRSLALVGQKLGKSTTLMERWSSKHDWKERVALWDNQIDHRQQTAEEKAAGMVALELARRRELVQTGAWEMFEKLKSKAEEMLQFPVGRRRATEKDAEGRDVAVTIEPAKWTFADLARVVNTADQLGRLATGLATGRQEVTGPDGKPFTLPTHSEPVKVVLRLATDEDTAAAVARFGEPPAQ